MPTGTELVPVATQQAAAPLLKSLKIGEAESAAFFRGEMVVGEVATPGKTGTIVFFQLKDGRLRAGIFSISIKQDPSAAVRAFGGFRGAARELARALGLSEMELMGAAVVNKDVAAMLESQGFVKGLEPLPESLGAQAGETIEVYTKRFPVRSTAVADKSMAPAVASEASAAGTAGAAGRTAGAAGRTAAAEQGAAAVEAAAAARTPAGGAAAVAGRVAGFAVRAIIFAVLMLGLEYLRAQAERRRFESRMQEAQPEIESALAALEPQVHALQRAAGGKTVWAHITIWLRHQHVVHGGMGMMAYDYSFVDAGFERAAVGLDYRKERSSELGSPISVPHGYGSSTITPNRELVTYSVPIPYDAATLDLATSLLRIQHLEEDARRPDLEPAVLEALFEERDALIGASPVE
jgi:hypothetical protein